MAPQAVEWRNRIVGIGEEDPEQLLANPRNFRMHPKSQQDALLGVLEEVGVVQDVLVNRTTGHLVDGHLRVTLALRTGQPAIPVKYIEVSEAEEALILATLDPIAAMAQADAQKLDELLREVSTESAAVQEMLAGLAESAGLYQDLPAAGGGGDDFDATPEAGPTRTQLGDVWQCGAHRLVVGDSTDPATVARLMAGEVFRVMWTDPPYGVSYADKNRFLNTVGRGNCIQEPIANDHMSEEETEALLCAVFPLAARYGTAGAACYVAAPAVPLHKRFIDALDASGFSYRHQLIWVKNQFVLGRSDYHYRHEPILYGWKTDGPHYFVDDHTQDSVFEVDKPHRSANHPTEKPVALVQRMIENSSKLGELVYDPFGGSGTTLIACERTNRRARLIEIEPRYADVILRRYEAESGQEATLIERAAVQVGELQNA